MKESRGQPLMNTFYGCLECLTYVVNLSTFVSVIDNSDLGFTKGSIKDREEI